MVPEEKIRLWRQASERGSYEDDFEEMSEYWDYRHDNYAGFEHEGSVLRMWMGPTEALYYSNSEISDGFFDELPWTYKTFEAKVRLTNLHYGSAGWGFWNHTMVVEPCMPIWFIYLRSRGSYPFQGLFAQVGNQFQPIILYEKTFLLTLGSLLGGLATKIANVKILSSKPTMTELDLKQWHVYRVEWRENVVNFLVDGKEVAKVPYKAGPIKARADIWIDNAVFQANKKDPGSVYRHVTQENRVKTYLEVDYVKIY